MRESLQLMLVGRPFVAIAMLLVAGILAGRYGRWSVEGGLMGLAAVVPFLFWRRSRWVAAAMGIFVVGATLYSERYRVRSPDDVRVVLSGEPELVTVRGKLVETPRVREVQAGKGEIAYSYGTIEVLELRKNKEEWRSATGRVAARLRGELTRDFFQGRTVEVDGVIAFPARASTPGLFDYRAYLHNTRVFYQLKTDSTNDWRLMSFEKMPVTERFRNWAAAVLQRGVPTEDEATEIIAAMTLGLRNSLSGEMSDVFMRTGTLHIVAISGLHVACIAYFFSRILRLFGMPRSVEGLIIIAVVWFYTLATGLQSSACRSALMATIFMMVWIVRRPTDLLNTVAASAALILAAQPEQLFQASFQLSFSVVTVIAMVVTFIERNYPKASVELRHAILRIDPLLPYELVPRWKKGVKWALGLAFANLVVSVASWVGSMPLTAHYFNTVTPVSLAANLLAVPLSSVSLGATVVSILVPWVAPLSNYVAWLFMTWTIEVVRWFGSFSFGYFYVSRPHPLFMVAYAAAVAVLVIPRLRIGLRRYASAAVVGLLSVLWLGFVYAQKPVATLTVLPCAGTPVLVEESGGRELLIDCSSARDADYMVKRFLRAKGLGSIDHLLITHGDAQVVGGFGLMWNEFAPEKVYTSGARMRSPGYREAIGLLARNKDRWETVDAGEDVAGWTLLHPPEMVRAFPRADDNAVVLRKKIGNWTILHLSDLGEAGQRKLLESNGDLRADVVVAGLPEQGEPLMEELLEVIAPRVIILGTTEYPYTARGTPMLRKRLEGSGAKVYYVDEEDAVTVTVNLDVCVVKTMAGDSVSLR